MQTGPKNVYDSIKAFSETALKQSIAVQWSYYLLTVATAGRVVVH